MTTKLKIYPNRIREWRETCKMTQQQVAQLMGMSAVNIGHLELERRDPSLSNLRALAKIFGVATIDLLSANDSIKS